MTPSKKPETPPRRGVTTGSDVTKLQHTSSGPPSSFQRETRAAARARQGEAKGALAPKAQTAAADEADSSKGDSPAAAQAASSMTALVSENPSSDTGAFSSLPWTNEEEQTRWRDHQFLNSKDGELEFTETLQKVISDFVWNMFPPGLTWQSLGGTIQAKLTAFCPKAAKYIEGEKYQIDCLFEGWIWHILYHNLWSSDCTDKWSGEWAHFGGLQGALRGRVTNEDNSYNVMYHLAKHFSTRMMYMLYGQHTDPERLTQIILDEIAPVIMGPANYGQYNSVGVYCNPVESLDVLKTSVLTIVGPAIELDFLQLASRRNITIQMHDPFTEQRSCFTYRKGSMKRHKIQDLKWSKEHNHIDFITGPFIQVYGDSGRLGGEPKIRNLIGHAIHNYHECTSTVPLRVVPDNFPQIGPEPESEPESEPDPVAVALGLQ